MTVYQTILLLKSNLFLKGFCLFICREGEGREKERERNINMWLPLPWPPLGTRPATGNRTGDPLVRSLCSIRWVTPARGIKQSLKKKKKKKDLQEPLDQTHINEGQQPILVFLFLTPLLAPRCPQGRKSPLARTLYYVKMDLSHHWVFQLLRVPSQSVNISSANSDVLSFGLWKCQVHRFWPGNTMIVFLF